MKWLGVKRVAIKSIVLPGNFAATKAAPRISDLATMIRRTDGPIHFPVVEAKSMRLLAGHDRIAALMALKEKRVEVRMWEGDADEFPEVQAIENVARRHDDRPSLIAELARIDALRDAPQASETEDLTQETVSRRRDTAGRVKEPPQTKAAETNKRVAAAAGVSVKTVRNAKAAAKSKDEASSTADPLVGGSKHAPAVEAEPALIAPLPDGFNAFGLEVSSEHRDRIEMLETMLEAWSRVTTNLLTELSRIEKISNPPLISRQAAESIRDKAHALGHVVREAIPTSLCFYCKNDDRAVVHCPACGSTGFVGRHAGDNVPPELKTVGVAARIAVDGRFILASDPMPGQKPKAAPPKKKGFRVVIENADGSETEVPLDDDEPAF